MLFVNRRTKKRFNWIFKFEWKSKKIETLQIKLLNIKPLTNISCMFSHCMALESLPDISKWDIKNVTDMSYMFCSCASSKYIADCPGGWYYLYNLPDTSQLNTRNITNMRCMFAGWWYF